MVTQIQYINTVASYWYFNKNISEVYIKDKLVIYFNKKYKSSKTHKVYRYFRAVSYLLTITQT